MSNEALKDDVELIDVNDNDSSNDEVEYTEEEVRAMEHGWAPKEEWRGNPDEWVSARVFNQKGELFGKIRSLERDRDSMKQEFKQATKAMVDMLKKSKETEYKRAVADLKKQKRSAIEDGDAGVALDIDDQIEELTTEHTTVQQEYDRAAAAAPAQEYQAPEFVEWQGRNGWYNEDSEMRVTADSVGLRYAQENPNLPITKVFEFVDKQMKRIYPEKFTNVNKEKPAKVGESGKRSTGGKRSKYSERDLTDEQKTIMNTMTRSGIMTKEEYIEELAKIGEIGG